jgi:hypothetical protein
MVLLGAVTFEVVLVLLVDQHFTLDAWERMVNQQVIMHQLMNKVLLHDCEVAVLWDQLIVDLRDNITQLRRGLLPVSVLALLLLWIYLDSNAVFGVMAEVSFFALVNSIIWVNLLLDMFSVLFEKLLPALVLGCFFSGSLVFSALFFELVIGDVDGSFGCKLLVGVLT